LIWCLFHRKTILFRNFIDKILVFRYNIDDLLTPNSSLTNVTSLPNGDTTRSLLGGHDGLTTNINNTTHTLSPSSSVNKSLPTIDPLHGLLLGNTTAFDAVTTQQADHCLHISPSQQQQQQQTVVNTTTSPNTCINDRFQTKGTIRNYEEKYHLTMNTLTYSSEWIDLCFLFAVFENIRQQLCAWVWVYSNNSVWSMVITKGEKYIFFPFLRWFIIGLWQIEIFRNKYLNNCRMRAYIFFLN